MQPNFPFPQAEQRPQPNLEHLKLLTIFIM